MSELVDRLWHLEGVLLDQTNGNEGHPSYYSAEVVHRAIERIEELEQALEYAIEYGYDRGKAIEALGRNPASSGEKG